MHVRYVLVAAAWIACGVFAQHPPHLSYVVTVKAGEPAFRYRLDIRRPDVDEVALSVAAWAPGSYRLMKAHDGIRDVAAVDETGAARAVVRDGDLTWRVASKGASLLRVTWTFDKFDRRKDNRSFFDKTSALLDGPRNYLYWRDRKDVPAHVRFEVPEGWTVACGLTPTFDPFTFTAKDVDWLLDCPVLMGVLEERRFEVDGVPHRVVADLGGRKPSFDVDRFVDCVRRCVVAGAELMGGLPYDHYSFLFAGSGGGLEHLTSTTIGISPAQLAGDPDHHEGVIAHEHFHAWNVKRLRPAALGPFDYDGPVRTKSLWWAEGVTNYYTNVLLARAGLMSEAEFLAGYRNLLTSYVNNPATRTFSPEETSWTVWDGPYLQGPVNYYDQGEVLGLLMDAEIRAATDGRRSLDDAVRLLYRRFSGARGFQSEDLIVGVRDATGVDLHAFFLDHVSGAKEPDWARAFAHLGVRFDASPRLAPALTLTGRSREDGGIEVTEVPAGSTAERFGLRAGDVITTVDGKPATTTGAFARRVRELGAGAELKATVRRDGKETALVGTLEPAGELAKAPLRADPESRGPRLGRLPAGAALDEAGFAAGDVLVRVGDVEVADVDAAKRALASVKVGDRVRVVARRGAATLQADVASKPWIVRDVVLDVDPEAPPARHALRRALLGVKPVAPASVEPARKAG